MFLTGSGVSVCGEGAGGVMIAGGGDPLIEDMEHRRRIRGETDGLLERLHVAQRLAVPTNLTAVFQSIRQKREW